MLYSLFFTNEMQVQRKCNRMDGQLVFYWWLIGSYLTDIRLVVEAYNRIMRFTGLQQIISMDL